MTEPASFIAFGLVGLFVSLATSALLALAFFALRPRLRSLGAYAERVGATLTIGLPPLLGLGIAGALALRSLFGGHLGMEDHCPDHGHHLHLCLYHGAKWAQQGWAVAVLAGACTAFAMGMARRLWRVFDARRALRRLARLAETQGGHAVPVSVAPANTVFCFTAGIFEPRIFISSAAWQKLDVHERRAVIEHELAHVAHGDVWVRGLLGGLALLGMPFLTGRVLAAWAHATECACDQRSAGVVGNPVFVASALVKLTRAAQLRVPTLAASFPSGDIAGRIERVLEDRPDGGTAARRIAACAAAFVVIALVAAGVLIDPLHHAIETLLGTI